MGTHPCGNGNRGPRDNHTGNWTFLYIMFEIISSRGWQMKNKFPTESLNDLH